MRRFDKELKTIRVLPTPVLKEGNSSGGKDPGGEQRKPRALKMREGFGKKTK